MATPARATPHKLRRSAPKQAITKEQRIDLRIQPDTKEIIQKAADLLGVSVSSFLVSTGLKAARHEIAEASDLTLSDRDRTLFLNALESPPAPNKTLRAAMSRFRRQA